MKEFIDALGVLGFYISSISLLVAVRAFNRKNGVEIRGMYGTSHSRNCSNHYVHEFVIENLKDRAVSIFGIYLKVGYNYYIELEDFEKNPFILKPYESYHKKLAAVEKYFISSKAYDFNYLLNSKKIRKNLYLATSEGKVKVKPLKRYWFPFLGFLKNHYTGWVKPFYSEYKGVSLGDNVAFIVEVIKPDDSFEIVPITVRDHEIRIFKGFWLTEDSLKDIDSLRAYLTEQKNNGELKCIDFKIMDVAAWRVENKLEVESLQAPIFSWSRYYLLGPFLTLLGNWNLKRKNSQAYSKKKQKKEPKT